MTESRVNGNLVYFIYRDIILDDLSATDFVGKIGVGTPNRVQTYTTPFGSGRLRKYVLEFNDDMDARVAEGRILAECRERGMIRKHISGRYSEVLHVRITSDMSIIHVINEYNKSCDLVKEIMDDVSNTIREPSHSDICEQTPVDMPVKVMSKDRAQQTGISLKNMKPEAFTDMLEWISSISIRKEREPITIRVQVNDEMIVQKIYT
jgi:hypothetical protein